MGEAPSGLLGASLRALVPDEVKAVLRWYQTGESPPEVLRGDPGGGPGNGPGGEATALWVLAEQSDGVVVARLDAANRLLSGPPPTPERARDRLLTLRCFSPVGDLLIWNDGEFRGRRLDPVTLTDEPARQPLKETLLVVGESVEQRDGGVVLRSRSGLWLSLPLLLRDPVLPNPVVLDVCHHLREDAETGALGIGATRLIQLRPRARDDGEGVRR